MPDHVYFAHGSHFNLKSELSTLIWVDTVKVFYLYSYENKLKGKYEERRYA
jgi:hypothetical protein